jgi:hypothetical protein
MARQATDVRWNGQGRTKGGRGEGETADRGVWSVDRGPWTGDRGPWGVGREAWGVRVCLRAGEACAVEP